MLFVSYFEALPPFLYAGMDYLFDSVLFSTKNATRAMPIVHIHLSEYHKTQQGILGTYKVIQILNFKCPAPGQWFEFKCPTPGTCFIGKCPGVARGGWARLDLTDALSLSRLLAE